MCVCVGVCEHAYSIYNLNRVSSSRSSPFPFLPSQGEEGRGIQQLNQECFIIIIYICRRLVTILNVPIIELYPAKLECRLCNITQCPLSIKL